MVWGDFGRGGVLSGCGVDGVEAAMVSAGEPEDVAKARLLRGVDLHEPPALLPLPSTVSVT